MVCGFSISGFHGYNSAAFKPPSNLQTNVDALRNENLQIERLSKVSMGFFPSSINVLGMMRKATINSEFPRKASHASEQILVIR